MKHLLGISRLQGTVLALSVCTDHSISLPSSKVATIAILTLYKFIYFWLPPQGLLFVAVRGLLIVVASLAVEHQV